MSASAGAGNLFTSADGHVLHYAIYGDDNARETIFFHHGLPGSQLEGRIFDAAARQRGLRVISVDRPGMGQSTYQPNLKLLDWPGKLLALADHLAVDAFAVLGVSGGAPYVLACLHELPAGRCAGGGVIAGVFPPATLGWAGMALETRLLFQVGAWTPWLVEKTLEHILGSVARDREHPQRLEEFLAKTFDSRPAVDRAVWDADKGGVRTMLVEDSRLSLQGGSKGAAWETYLAANDWGFRLEDIAVGEGRLVMWHGGVDANWPLALARKADKLIEGAELRVSEAEGHVSVFANKVDEVMDTMSGLLK